MITNLKTKMTKPLNFKLNNMFSKPAIYAGYLFMLVSIYAFYKDSPILGIFIILICGHFSFSYTGVLVNSENKTYKSYISYFGLKLGGWKSLKNYKYISILSRNYTQGLNSMEGMTQGYDIMLKTLMFEMPNPVPFPPLTPSWPMSH